jgi:hypothetical protein
VITVKKVQVELLEEWIDSILEKSNQAENNRHEII